MRILCLHGMGTSSKIFESQTAALRSELGDPHVHTFEFVEGSVDSPPAPGISHTFPEIEEHYAYYDPSSARSITKAIDDLSSYLAADGPFDGVMGFSQGAALAAMLLARDSLAPPFSFAIFICAGAPYDEARLKKKELRYLDSQVDKQVIRVPTAHILGAKDDALEASMQLVDLCWDKKRLVFDHGAGHEVPVNPVGVVGNMSRCVEDVISKATFVQ